MFPDTRAIREIARVGVTVLTVHERWYPARFKEIVALRRARRCRTDGRYWSRQAVALYHVKPLKD